MASPSPRLICRPVPCGGEPTAAASASSSWPPTARRRPCRGRYLPLHRPATRCHLARICSPLRRSSSSPSAWLHCPRSEATPPPTPAPKATLGASAAGRGRRVTGRTPTATPAAPSSTGVTLARVAAIFGARTACFSTPLVTPAPSLGAPPGPQALSAPWQALRRPRHPPPRAPRSYLLAADPRRHPPHCALGARGGGACPFHRLPAPAGQLPSRTRRSATHAGAPHTQAPSPPPSATSTSTPAPKPQSSIPTTDPTKPLAAVAPSPAAVAAHAAIGP